MEKLNQSNLTFRTSTEALVGQILSAVFEENTSSIEHKLEQFPKYIRRQRVTRFLALYELFKLILPIKGSIVECGVNEGFGLMSWAHFSSILEPNNLTRRIYGFDTFCGFEGVSTKDASNLQQPNRGELSSDSYEELTKIIQIYDTNRFLGHVDKVHLERGDIIETAPEFLKKRPHVIVSLLFLDLDLYEPTKIALETFLPRMPRGAVLAFDELDNPIWPGETLALLDSYGISRVVLKRFDFDPYIAYGIL